MAKKKRRHPQAAPPLPTPNPTPRPLPSRPSSLRADDLASTINGMGGVADPLVSLWSVKRPFSTSYGLADALYATDEFAVSVIEALPSDAARAGCSIVVGDGSDKKPEPFKEEMLRLNVLAQIYQARVWARQYGGAGLFIDVDDGMDPAEPLNPAAVKKINRLIPIDRWALIPSDNSENPEFYTLAIYVVQFKKVMEMEGSPRIHGSRVIRMVGRNVVPRLRIQLNGWGLSIFDTLWPAIRDFQVVNQATATISTSLEHGVVAIEGLRSAIEAGNEAEVQNRLLALNQAKSVVGMMVIDKDSESFERSTSTAGTGADKIWQVLAARLAGAAGQPVTRMFGQSPSGLSTDDNSGRRWWQNRVSVEQTDNFEPAVRRICDLLVESGAVTLPAGTKYEIQWLPTDTPTEKERAEALNVFSQAIERFIKSGVLSPQEGRAVFANVSWTPDIRLLDSSVLSKMTAETKGFLLDPQDTLGKPEPAPSVAGKPSGQ